MFELVFSLPFYLYGIVANQASGTLTGSYACEMLVESIAMGAAVAAAVWYAITLPIIRRSGGK
ncbi:MAG TPA: hypothetical protein VFW40_07955 [Capsulimonadaceae bacterium]|nr:hypothetical protein [Capsulimonadaceae bacterium]